MNIAIGANKLKPEGAVAIADALKVNTTLLSIELGICFFLKIVLESNAIGPDGAKAIAEMLTVNKTLELINLSKP